MKESDRTTKYVILKKCLNCDSANSQKNNACAYCGLLFVEKMEFEDWTNHCAALALKADDKKKKEKETGIYEEF